MHLIKFIITGVINTAHFYLWYVLFLTLGMELNIAFSLGFILSLIGSYFLNTYFTFKVKPNLKSFLKYPITALPNFIISNVGVYLLAEKLNVNRKLSGVLAGIIAIPITFLVTKYILVGTRRNQ